jgi:MFS family permease
MSAKNKNSFPTSGSSGVKDPLAAANQSLSFAKVIRPILLTVFAAYLAIGIALGALPSFIKNDLHYGSLAVGLVIGLQALATLLTRAYAGKITDVRGAHRSKQFGALLLLAAGVLYVLATLPGGSGIVVLTLLVVGRIIHGISESMVVTASLTWAIGLVGRENAGKVMTWNGIAMYAGIAVGAPLSLWVTTTGSVFIALAAITILALVSLVATRNLPHLAVDVNHLRTPFYKVIGLVANQGLALAFASIGFACIASFISLLFAAQHWEHASWGFISFGGFYILTRIFFASFPDKFGGYTVAFVSFVVEMVGQLLIGVSSSPLLAIAGCALTGMGFSLVFPALGVLAIQRVAPQMRGTALAAYSAFFDLSLSIAGPVAGLLAAWWNYPSIYLFGSVSCLVALLILSFSKPRKPA